MVNGEESDGSYFKILAVQSHPASPGAGKTTIARAYLRQLDPIHRFLNADELAQRFKMGGHPIPSADVRRRFKRSRSNFVSMYAPFADLWTVWDNRPEPPRLLLSSETARLPAFTELS